MPSFEYEPLILFPKLKTSNEEENKGDTDGTRPSGTKTTNRNQETLEEGRIALRRRLLVRHIHHNKL